MTVRTKDQQSSQQDVADQELKGKHRKMWALGDYARVADYEATGKAVPAAEFMTELRAALETRLAKK